MPSFVPAETFEYFCLLFSPASILNFNQVMVTAEAHPLRRDPR